MKRNRLISFALGLIGAFSLGIAAFMTLANNSTDPVSAATTNSTTGLYERVAPSDILMFHRCIPCY